MEQIIELRGKPQTIRCDNGPKYISGALLNWTEQQGFRIEHIQRGKPQQNAYIEHYNRTVRYAWLAQTLFDSIEQVQDKPPVGYGLTTTSARTWASAASLQCKN